MVDYFNGGLCNHFTLVQSKMVTQSTIEIIHHSSFSECVTAFTQGYNNREALWNRMAQFLLHTDNGLTQILSFAMSEILLIRCLKLCNQLNASCKLLARLSIHFKIEICVANITEICSVWLTLELVQNIKDGDKTLILMKLIFGKTFFPI